MLALHTQGSVIYPGPEETAPPGAHALAQAFSAASGYPVEPVPPESANAGFKDWFLQVFKRPAFTIEAGLGENPLPTSQHAGDHAAPSARFFTAAIAVVRYPENHNFLFLHTLHCLWYTEDRNQKGVQRIYARIRSSRSRRSIPAAAKRMRRGNSSRSRPPAPRRMLRRRGGIPSSIPAKTPPAIRSSPPATARAS